MRPRGCAPSSVAVVFRRMVRGRDGRRAFDRLLPRFLAHGYLVDTGAWLGFVALCHVWEIYCLVERLAARRPTKEVRATLARCRAHTRELAAEWFLLDPARAHLARLTRGQDLELRHIFSGKNITITKGRKS